MLLQMEQRRSLSFTSRTAAARAMASSSEERRMWKARRCADFPPMPGSFLSSSMRRAIGSANLDIGFRHWSAQSESGDSHAAHHAAHGGLHLIVYLAAGFVAGGEHEVLQHLHVAGLHDLRIDGDGEELLLSVHADLDGASASGGFYHGLLHLFLQRVVLLFRLRHQALKIEATHEFSLAPKPFSCDR